MGTTYRKRLELIMIRYQQVWQKAQAEFERSGEISDHTDAQLRALELELDNLQIV